MSGRQSSATDKALLLVGKPKDSGGVWTAYAAARHHKLALSTIYRAIKRRLDK